MQSVLRDKLFHNWHTMRWVALGAGLFFLIQAVWYLDGISGFLAAFFLFQAVTNSGCFGSRSCDVSSQTQELKNGRPKHIEFTELKND